MGELFALRDVLDRNIELGNLVLILSNTHDNYGIVISSDEVFTMQGIKEPSRVYLIENLLLKEEEIKKKLVYSYDDRIQRKTLISSSGININVGDVFGTKESAENYYVYLGYGKLFDTSTIVEGYCYLRLYKYQIGHLDKYSNRLFSYNFSKHSIKILSQPKKATKLYGHIEINNYDIGDTKVLNINNNQMCLTRLE